MIYLENEIFVDAQISIRVGEYTKNFDIIESDIEKAIGEISNKAEKAAEAGRVFYDAVQATKIASSCSD